MMSGSLVICECFARDGLQHETVRVGTRDKVALIDAMTEAGFPRIEATSYSHPKRVPGFSDASEVLACLTSAPMGQFRHIAERRVSGSS